MQADRIPKRVNGDRGFRVMARVVAFDRKRRLDAGGGSWSLNRDYLEANGTLYFTAALFLALLWNWFGLEFVEPGNDMRLVWLLIDVAFPLLMAATGIRLLREASAQSG